MQMGMPDRTHVRGMPASGLPSQISASVGAWKELVSVSTTVSRESIHIDGADGRASCLELRRGCEKGTASALMGAARSALRLLSALCRWRGCASERGATLITSGPGLAAKALSLSAAGSTSPLPGEETRQGEAPRP